MKKILHLLSALFVVLLLAGCEKYEVFEDDELNPALRHETLLNDNIHSLDGAASEGDLRNADDRPVSDGITDDDDEDDDSKESQDKSSSQ
jgi:hypothetical protein